MENAINEYSSVKISNGLLEQSELDLGRNRNSNMFEYRGQFSPDLIKSLLQNYAPPNSIILDPFCGCGTVLFEAAKQGHSAIGIDINPAGVLMAKTVQFHNLDATQREKIFLKTKKVLTDIPISKAFENSLIGKISSMNDEYVKNILINAYMKYSNARQCDDKNLFERILVNHIENIRRLPFSNKKYLVFHGDVRNELLQPKSVNLIMTSPPYINVLNYHQYYREITETLGFDVLRVAKSEFGSNRKNRQNRFLTVAQYILDMADSMDHLKIYLKDDGRFIIVIGRQSNVRGIPFRNDMIIGSIAVILGYKIDLHQERKFKNQFGEIIYEDVIHLVNHEKKSKYEKNQLFKLIEYVFNVALKMPLQDDVRRDIDLVVKQVRNISQSPIFVNEVLK